MNIKVAAFTVSEKYINTVSTGILEVWWHGHCSNAMINIASQAQVLYNIFNAQLNWAQNFSAHNF